MPYQHGRGKQSFRDFTKSLNDELRDIRQAIKEGEEYTANDISRFLTRIVNEYVVELKAQELDVEMWSDRAIDYSYQKGEEIILRYELETEEEASDEEGSGFENDEVISDDTGGDDTLYGFPLVSSDNKAEVRASSVPRKRVMTTLEELYEYISKVPYVTFIQIIENADGERIYRVWVEQAKQKKRRKNAS